MAFQFFQIPTSVETAEKSQTRTERWRATGSSSSSYVNSYARSATAGVIATIHGTLWRQDMQLKQTAYNQWDVTVPYGPRKNETGEWTWDFDTTGGSVHITNGKEEVGRFPADKAPD